jgi:hypothetical protein
MKTHKMVTNTSASLKSGTLLTKIDRGDVARFSLFVLVGCLAILYPVFVLGCLAAAATLGFGWLVVGHVRRAGLELWQVLVLIALTGYQLLNYGFENLAIHIGGFPIIISYGLMYASLALALIVSGRQHLMARSLKEPAVLCMLALLVFTLFHLLLDIPKYGIWALRDGSMCLDGMFMLLGLLWATKPNSTSFLTKWMMVVFAVNMIYGFTLPWGEKLWSWSPQSGVFQKTPILGNYDGTGDLLLSGALFCICLGGYVLTRPRWMMLFLALAQFLGVAITQVRRMYVAAVIVFIVLVLIGETKKYAKLFILLPSSLLVILLATSFGGLQISGRIGVVNLEFFKDHIRSMSDAEGTPGSSVESRVIMADEAYQRFLLHPMLGEGFGQPLLTDLEGTSLVVTRMPHNSSLSYLARLGVIGFAIWIAFHLCITKRFVYALRQRRSCEDKRLCAFVLWCFLFYILFMIGSLVEAAFEFPSGAVPFYFFMGLALGLIRWQIPQTNRIQSPKGSNRSYRDGNLARYESIYS